VLRLKKYKQTLTTLLFFTLIFSPYLNSLLATNLLQSDNSGRLSLSAADEVVYYSTDYSVTHVDISDDVSYFVAGADEDIYSFDSSDSSPLW